VEREWEILGQTFIEWLVKQGIIKDSLVQRVVIDAPYNDVMRVYVQRLGSTVFLGVDLPAELRVELKASVMEV
jgi:hypothetical protein